ncbi:MAG: aminoacyl-tRNA deacylase [Thermodesulfobacteriota bacterium]
MAKKDATPGVYAARSLGLSFTLHPYDFVERGGAPGAAEKLQVPLHSVVKTLVMEDDAGRPFLVLMHGDREVDRKALAAAIRAKKVSPCNPETAQKHTGYLVGGISPLGAKKAMPLYVESSICDLPEIYLNAGRRGLLMKLDPRELCRALTAVAVHAAAAG